MDIRSESSSHTRTTFNLFRTGSGPTLYPSDKTAVTVDVLVFGFVFACSILALSLCILSPGFYGNKLIQFFIKVTLGLFITISIIVCNFGQDWEVAKVNATTQYKAGVGGEINADIGVYIGLRSVNITLKGHNKTIISDNGNTVETINYNERFSWNNLAFTQGRLGFGPFAGRFNQEYRRAQLRGAPYPILWVAEYFTIDGEGIRWGRFYRQAGYYTHITIWLAFPMWILTIILLHMVVKSAGYMCCLTGLVLITANIIYAFIRNPQDLVIPINGESILRFNWGWCFYLNVFTGILCLLLGVIILYMNHFCYGKIARFVGTDMLHYYDEDDNIIVITENGSLRKKIIRFKPNTKVNLLYSNDGESDHEKDISDSDKVDTVTILTSDSAVGLDTVQKKSEDIEDNTSLNQTDLMYSKRKDAVIVNLAFISDTSIPGQIVNDDMKVTVDSSSLDSAVGNSLKGDIESYTSERTDSVFSFKSQSMTSTTSFS